MQRIDSLVLYLEREFAKERIPCYQVKTKYGQVRAYVQLNWRCLLNITHPHLQGYVEAGYPSWLVKLDIYWGTRVGFNVWVENLTHNILKKRYRRVYEKAIQLYPGYRKALLDGASYPEYLVGLR